MMSTTNIQYISDNNGEPTGVIVPIALWKKIEATQTWLTTNQENAWDVLETLVGTVEAPSDWSVQHDHYLYGTPKRQSETTE